MSTQPARYAVQSVGGCWDLWVVFDRTKRSCASAHWTDNWVARYPDDQAGYEKAVAKAKQLNEMNEQRVLP